MIGFASSAAVQVQVEAIRPLRPAIAAVAPVAANVASDAPKLLIAPPAAWPAASVNAASRFESRRTPPPAPAPAVLPAAPVSFRRRPSASDDCFATPPSEFAIPMNVLAM